VILSAVKTLNRRKGRVVLCCLNGYVSEIFEVNRFKDIITITDSIESGFKAFSCEFKAA
jgi:anti-anti-sigma factor